MKGASLDPHCSLQISDMPAAPKPPQKRKAPAFKPPRPASKVKTKATTDTSRRKSAPARTAAVSISSSDDELASSSIQGSSEPVAPHAIEDPPPTIPPKLLTRILHHQFKDSDIRIGKDANELIGKYMDTFVREAIARATIERSEAEGGGLGGEFLEVSRYTSDIGWIL